MTDQLQDIIGKRFDVLGDQGWVELVDFMPHPSTGVSGDLAIVNAARVSFLGESKGEEKDAKLLRYLMKHRHTTPFEMVEFKLRVSAPVVTWWQWARHRTFSFNAQSGRYTPFDEDSMFVPAPDEWRKQSASNKQGSSGDVFTDEEQNAFIDRLGLASGKVSDMHYEFGVGRDGDAGFTELLQLYSDIGQDIYQRALDAGMAKEQARLFLPGWGLYYKWIVKVDAHNLMNFLKLRMDSHAQYEIRVYAQTIYDEIFKVALPVTAQAFEDYVLNPQS